MERENQMEGKELMGDQRLRFKIIFCQRRIIISCLPITKDVTPDINVCVSYLKGG